MLKLQEIEDKLEKEFMSDIGYEHNDRFTDPHSPYYGQRGWLTYTDDSTCCELYCFGDEWYVRFSFIGISAKYAIDWCKDFLQEQYIKFTKIEPVYDDEKGWFSVHAYVSKKSICEKYGLYDKYLEAFNSDQIKTYNKLIETLENFDPNIKDITDINNVTDISKGWESYFRFGDDSDHVSIKIGGKDTDDGLAIFSAIYIKVDGNTIRKSDYIWSNDYKEHIYELKDNLRFHFDDMQVTRDLYHYLYNA